MDRTAFRRLDPALHAAEEALLEWGRWRSRDRAPNDLPGQAPFYAAMHKEWLEAARTDPPADHPWMARMVAYYQAQSPIVQTFMRLRWQHGRSLDQVRVRLNMSVRRATETQRTVREHVARYVGP